MSNSKRIKKKISKLNSRKRNWVFLGEMHIDMGKVEKAILIIQQALNDIQIRLN